MPLPGKPQGPIDAAPPLAVAVSSEAQLASDAVMALARAARSFVLYEPRNSVIRQLLDNYRARMRAALSQLGELALMVHPFEIVFRGEVVYEDDDREKSMAFKLYRDGVRRLSVLPDIEWVELLQLLEVIALRYTAVRQQEDDAVTLLRGAELKGVRLSVVEGFTPDEERPEPDDPEPKREERAKPPEGWDTPLPRLQAPIELKHRPVSANEQLAMMVLRAEVADDALAEMGLFVGRDLLAVARQRAWPAPHRGLVDFFGELRDSYLGAGDMQSLSRLVEFIGRDGEGEVRDDLLSRLGDARTLDLILDALPERAAELPREMLAIVPLLSMNATLDRMAAEPDPRRRALLVKLALARLPREADALLQRLPSLEPSLARQVASGLAARASERTFDVARLLLGQKDPALRLEGIETLARSEGEIPKGPLLALLEDDSELVRIKVAEVLSRRGEQSAVDPMVRSLEGKERSAREAEAFGRALAELAPIPAIRLFTGWLKPKTRLLGGKGSIEKRLQWAAVAGLAHMPGEEPVRLLKAAAAEGDDELQRHCLAALASQARRRKGAVHG